MSESIMRRVWDHAPVARIPNGSYELLVLLALAHEADDGGLAPFREVDYLAAKTRQPVWSVKQSINALLVRGLLEYRIAPTGEPKYVLHIPDPDQEAV